MFVYDGEISKGKMSSGTIIPQVIWDINDIIKKKEKIFLFSDSF